MRTERLGGNKLANRKDFKSQEGFERWLEAWPEKIAYFPRELSALSDPGEFDELPIAVVRCRRQAQGWLFSQRSLA